VTILPWGGGRRIRSIVNSITLMFKISSNRIYLHAIACHLDTGIRVPSCFFLVGVGGGQVRILDVLTLVWFSAIPTERFWNNTLK